MSDSLETWVNNATHNKDSENAMGPFFDLSLSQLRSLFQKFSAERAELAGAVVAVMISVDVAKMEVFLPRLEREHNGTRFPPKQPIQIQSCSVLSRLFSSSSPFLG